MANGNPQADLSLPGVKQPFTFNFRGRKKEFESFEAFKKSLAEGPNIQVDIKEFEAFAEHLRNTLRIGQEQQTARIGRVKAQAKEASEARRRAARAFSRTQTILAGTGQSISSHFLSRPSILSGGGS